MQPFKKSFGTLLITSLLGSPRRWGPRVTSLSRETPRNLRGSVLNVSSQSVTILLSNTGQAEVRSVRVEYRAGPLVLVHHEPLLSAYEELVVELKLPEGSTAGLYPRLWIGQAS